jgi:hypothetical protein
MGALVGAVVVVVVVGGGAALWAWRSSGTRWARSVALPEIVRLADHDRNGEAFLLATQAETRIAGDPVLNGLWSRISRPVSITTTPAGADVSVRLIGANTTWQPIGRTPLVNTRLPRGVFWWRFEKAGYEPSRSCARPTSRSCCRVSMECWHYRPREAILPAWSPSRFLRRVCDSR